MTIIGLPTFAISVSDSDIEMKEKIVDCLEASVDDENDIFDDVMCLPDSLKEFQDIPFLEMTEYLPCDKEFDLFLLLNHLFGDTYLVVSDAWDFEEENENGYDEIKGSKSVWMYIPDGFKKYTFGLEFSEALKSDGSSTGVDIVFNGYRIKKKQLKNETPSDSFVEEMLEKAEKKGHADLMELIKEKFGK